MCVSAGGLGGMWRRTSILQGSDIVGNQIDTFVPTLCAADDCCTQVDGNTAVKPLPFPA